MLNLCNMKITLKKIKDCRDFFEKTQISHADKKL